MRRSKGTSRGAAAVALLLTHRYCEHLIDRPLSPIEAGRVLHAAAFRLGVSPADVEVGIWAWENRPW